MDGREIMGGKSPSEAPLRGELEQVLRRLAPEISRLFREHRASEEEARQALGESLAGFSRKWGRVVNRERWLLRALERSLRALRREPPDSPPYRNG
jgi:uncharacterized membrane protein YccC